MKPIRDIKGEADKLVRDIKRATRRKFSTEEKIRIVLAGVRGEDSIAELCRRGRACIKIYIIAGARSSLKPRKSAWRGIRSARPAGTRCRPSSKPKSCWRTGCSKKAWLGLGRTLYEICGHRKARDHPHG